MPQENFDETPPQTMAEAYAEMDLFLTDAFDAPTSQIALEHEWRKVGQVAAGVGKKLKFWDKVTDTEQSLEILGHNEEQNELTVQVAGHEEPSKIRTSIFRGAAEYTIKYKKSVAVVSIAVGSLYVLAKKRKNI